MQFVDKNSDLTQTQTHTATINAFLSKQSTRTSKCEKTRVAAAAAPHSCTENNSILGKCRCTSSSFTHEYYTSIYHRQMRRCVFVCGRPQKCYECLFCRTLFRCIDLWRRAISERSHVVAAHGNSRTRHCTEIRVAVSCVSVSVRSTATLPPHH